jgi:hypothetical protein
MEIKAYARVLVRGGKFSVVGRASQAGFWELRFLKNWKTITVPEIEVVRGMEDFDAEEGVQSIRRLESPARTIASNRYLSKKY